MVGTTSAMETFGSAALQVATTGGGTLVLGREDSSVAANNGLGAVYFDTYAGGAWAESAVIAAEADGTQGSNDYPTRLVFKTTADGSSADTERLRIDNTGRLLLGSQRTYSDQSYYDDITINNSNGSGASGGTGITLISDSGSWGAFLFGDEDDTDVGSIKYDHGNNIMRFTAGTTDTFQINATTATFAGNVNLANTKTIKFPGAGSDPGATIKHQSGNLEINNDTGNVYFDTAGAHYLRTGGSTVALTIDGSQNSTFAGTVSDSKGDLRKIVQNYKTANYTLVSSDAGKSVVQATGGTTITVPNSVFAAGEAITIIGHSGSDITIAQSSGLTLYNTSDGTTGNRTLASRGMATLIFTNGSTAYISGAGLS